MKISIGTKIQKGPWGGGNLFAINISRYLEEKGHKVVYNLKDNDIDIILLTDPRADSESASFDHYDIFYYKNFINPNTVVFHRINECDERKGTNYINKYYIKANKVADATIFVSSWLMKIYNEQGLVTNNQKVILAGADKNIFNTSSRVKWNKTSKLKIVTHHWGADWNKGFEIYKQIDEKLDEKEFSDFFEFTFIGNLPNGFKFNNASHINPLVGVELARKLKENNIYLTASVNEPSGNHHIEAAQCGLPLLYINSGGIPEYCKGYGVSFESSEFFNKLLELKANYQDYFNKVSNYPNNSVKMSSEFLSFFEEIKSRKIDISASKVSKSNLIIRSVYKFIIIIRKLILTNRIKSIITHAIFKK